MANDRLPRALSTSRSPSLSSRRAVPPLGALRAFEALGRLGGVRKAAEALSVDHSTISRHIRILEAWTGAALVATTGRGVTLTDTGWRYHEEVAAGLGIISSATLDLIQQGDEHRLSIWSVPGFAFQWLMPRLEQFREANPGLSIELRPAETSPDFSAHEADVDIRYVPPYGAPPKFPANTRTLEIGRLTVFVVASPEYLARSAQIRAPIDLLAHPLIQERDFDDWRAWLEGCGIADAVEVPGPRLWHAHLSMEAARRGHGVALASLLIACDDLKAGRLVKVTFDEGEVVDPRPGAYVLVVRADRWAEPQIARFRQWLAAAVRAEVDGERPEG